MSKLSMPQLAREMAESNRRAADSVEAGSWRSEKIQDADALRRRATRSARELTRFTLSRRSGARAVWEGALEVFEEGVGGEESKEVLEVVGDVIDTWLALAQKTRDWWRDVAVATGAMPEGLEDLDAAEREVKEVRAAAEKMCAFLGRARPPIDPGSLGKGRQEIAEGRFKTPEQMRARLGGPKA